MALLLLQVLIVLLTTLLCGAVARRLGQSRVIGEIVGGILLGPSVFGRFAPHAWAGLFPLASLGPFDVLSTFGLILFLFLVGAELDLDQLRTHKKTAAVAGGASLLLPMVLAALLSHPLRRRFAPQHVGGWPFFLFLGISLSMTALPVLARILEERRLSRTSLGVTALVCAATADVFGWSLLAFALTLVPSGGKPVSLPLRLLGVGAYTLVMLGLLRPLSKWLAGRRKQPELSYEAFAITVAIILGSAAATDAIGVHPLFGAFLAGLCFPRIPAWQEAVRSRLEMIVPVLLLPLFFALTGMKTRLDLLGGTRIWLWTGVIVVGAVVGKVFGASLGARFTGRPWRESMALGALLNTRGLMELIVLNIAYNAHVFSPELFTMLVFMALVTTVATTPLLNWIGYQPDAQEARRSSEPLVSAGA